MSKSPSHSWQLQKKQTPRGLQFPDDKFFTIVNNQVSEASLKYIAGYLAFVLKRKHKLQFGFPSSTSELEEQMYGEIEQEWTRALSYGGLLIPTDAFLIWIRKCEKTFRDCFPTDDALAGKPGILILIQHKLHSLNIDIDRRVIEEFSRLRLKIRLKSINAAARTNAKRKG